MASSSNSLDNLTNLYKHVIDDVVRSMKEEYLNEGMDPELLEELKQLWLRKLSLSGAVSRPTKQDMPSRPSKESSSFRSSHKQSGLLSSASSSQQATPLSLPLPPPLTPDLSSSDSVIHHAPSRGTPTSSPAVPSLLPANSPALVLHQSLLAAMSPSSSAAISTASATPPLVIASQATPISGSKTGVDMTGITPAINPFSNAMNLGMVNPAANQVGQLAQSMVPVQTPQGTVLVSLQNFMAFHALKQQQQQQQQQQQATPTGHASQTTASDKGDEVVQLDGPVPLVAGTDKIGARMELKPRAKIRSVAVPGSRSWFQHGTIVQLDGGQADSSSDENSDPDEDSSEDEVDQPEALHDSPLNSEDDIAEEEDEGGEGKDFETKDSIVCQWEKVYRVKTRWKFQLKDGIMHLGGHDYVFHKVAGEADW